MKEQLIRLKDLRKLESDLKIERDKAIEKIPQVIEFNLIKQNREEVESEIRKEAIERYNETGEKKFGMVGIRITSKYDYDELAALNWAKSHDLCLALDKTAFKKQMKVQPLDFVTISEVPTATIPTEIKEGDLQ